MKTHVFPRKARAYRSSLSPIGLHLSPIALGGLGDRSLESWGGPHDGPKPCTEAHSMHGFANGRKSALFFTTPFCSI